MKKIMLTILLLSSIGLNIFLLSSNDPEMKETSNLSIGLSETYELLFDQIDQFNDSHVKYNNGEIDLEEFEIHRKITFVNVGRIFNILDSFNVIPIEELESYMALEDYYYSFNMIDKIKQDESLLEIGNVIKENSNLTVAMNYENDKLLKEGNIPDEILILSNDLGRILKKLNLDYYN